MRLGIVNIETFLDGLLVVIGPAFYLCTVQQTLHEDVLTDYEVKCYRYLLTALLQHLLKCLGLNYGAGESVKNDSGTVTHGVIDAGQHVNDQIIRYELSFFNITFGYPAKF